MAIWSSRDNGQSGPSPLNSTPCLRARCAAASAAGAVGLDVLRPLAEGLAHALQHVDEARPAVRGGMREIGAAPERLALGVQNMVSGQPPCSPMSCSACM
jgi:hypothetical protein